MSDEEAQSRWEDLHNHVTTQTAQAFVTTFLNRTIRSNTEHTASLDDPSSLAVTQPVPRLGPQLLISKYKHSMRRLILVDFEGTLWRRDLTKNGLMEMVRMGVIVLDDKGGPGKGEKKLPDLPKEVEEAVEVLGKLADDWKNEVWLLSGLRVKGILEAVAERVPRVGIVAENGCFVKMREVGRNVKEEGQKEQKWISMISNLNLTWKSACLEILNYVRLVSPHFNIYFGV